MPQFSDSNAWQSWFQQASVAASPVAGKGVADLAVTLDPVIVNQLQNDYMQQFTTLWQDLLAMKTPPVADKRFKAPAWQSNTLYAFNAAAYLLNARFLMSMADAAQAPPKVKQKIRFAVQQTIDAMSPSNFLVTNPEAQKKILETKGESLTKGLANMLADMHKGRISQTDESAFEVGRNVATTEGAVVFENELFQLIQYKPLTETVYERPMLFVPPCINKYYIMDLQPGNSLVRYTVDQGHTVFLVSWRNADQSVAQATWDDYISDGVIKAIQVVQEISKQEQINALGFCVGGTLIASALAILFARGEKPVTSLTLLTALLDFSDTGVIDVYIDEAQVGKREQEIGRGGLMPGRDFAAAFSSLRSNDLVWNYVESNYLKGEEPPPFDLLYWNADSTNLPGPMFCWYLRNMYLENNLRKPGKLSVLDEKIDLGKINVPVFIYASREDHIVPWNSAYASNALLNIKKPRQNRFILGASGHIAGVINPPAQKKRSYWTNDNIVPDPKAWLAGATEHAGSWWPEWSAFLMKHSGKKVNAPRKYGSTKFKPIEPAPGRYVKEKAD
ncbi:MAG: class I poly(R)-hydroxyalkanoic acid synthase [Burkholderiales bacterium RIFCSPLOWO2_02_FULL_57_36]|nr:MAG: class I poly(R)-hydroxyalkanoic acid synthase [Burkholderiales bacterium RIFCSPLOWO2_02_FULL_57_36]